MAIDEKTLAEIKTLFELLDNVQFKKMFGGIGIFRYGIMFSMISKSSQLYFRANHEDVNKYESLGARSFNPHKKGKGMPYWEVPKEVISNREMFIEWAEEAYQIALEAKK